MSVININFLNQPSQCPGYRLTSGRWGWVSHLLLGIWFLSEAVPSAWSSLSSLALSLLCPRSIPATDAVQSLRGGCENTDTDLVFRSLLDVSATLSWLCPSRA